MGNDEILTSAGVDLASVTIKNTASVVYSRIRQAKANKNLAEQNNVLQEIINDLITDKTELLRIAQVYESELSAQKITDDEIKYITENLLPLLQGFVSGKQTKDLDKIQKLLSKEMITILQLVGFNYKKAIGEPLTNLVRNFIESKIPEPKQEIDQNRVLLAMINLAKDGEAFGRFEKLASWGGEKSQS